ncbi:MAG: hypothetical protein OEZ01_11950, partial [Candidatus Heimdallarchaeota archaeon]|nr:hypothetical protein [Candidatus Heimdallarchaeota archaeon]
MTIDLTKSEYSVYDIYNPQDTKTKVEIQDIKPVIVEFLQKLKRDSSISPQDLKRIIENIKEITAYEIECTMLPKEPDCRNRCRYVVTDREPVISSVISSVMASLVTAMISLVRNKSRGK